MTFAAQPYKRVCGKCSKTYSTDAPGARWTNRKGNPRYLHPGCEQPKKDWKPVNTPNHPKGAPHDN
ncbi:MAG: hypothetical protein ACK4F4_07200 [Hylemonella sp.]|uniref:hypothetical protein n=1 Tax=Hylemonella sp. TaxID=2066020 RepID=UPI00391D0625